MIEPIKLKTVTLWNNSPTYHGKKLKEWHDVLIVDFNSDPLIRQYMDPQQLPVTKHWSLEVKNYD